MASPFDAFVAYWSDPLADKSAQEIAAYYSRLAAYVEAIVGKGNSLAAKFLLHWLSATGKPMVVNSAAVSDVPYVNAYLAAQVRPVFLGLKPVAHTKNLGGLRQRLLKQPSFDRKAITDSKGNINMMYEGPPVGTISKTKVADIIKRHKEGKQVSHMERRCVDLFLSLHKFGIKSDVTVSARPVFFRNKRMEVFDVTFLKWECQGFDTYDWNYDLGFPVPNPDYKSEATNAIAKDKEVVVIRHKHAKKVIDKGLARDFSITISSWRVTDYKVIGPTRVDFGAGP